VLAIYGFSSIEEMAEVHAKVMHDEAVGKALHVLESGSEPAFEPLDSWVVEAADYSPEIKPEAAETPRIFELRIYHSPTWRQLGLLHERFDMRPFRTVQFLNTNSATAVRWNR